MIEIVPEGDAIEMWLDDLMELSVGETDYPFGEWCADNQIEPQ